MLCGALGCTEKTIHCLFLNFRPEAFLHKIERYRIHQSYSYEQYRLHQSYSYEQYRLHQSYSYEQYRLHQSYSFEQYRLHQSYSYEQYYSCAVYNGVVSIEQ